MQQLLQETIALLRDALTRMRDIEEEPDRVDIEGLFGGAWPVVGWTIEPSGRESGDPSLMLCEDGKVRIRSTPRSPRIGSVPFPGEAGSLTSRPEPLRDASVGTGNSAAGEHSGDVLARQESAGWRRVA